MSDLLERAMEAHGGVERFDSVREITVDMRCGGAAFAMRFKRGALAHVQGRVLTKDARTTLSPYPSAGQSAVFEGDRVRIETAEDGERWRRLRVRFPADVPTHSPEQDFYFDESFRLRRLDYTALVIGSWAHAAHYCYDHRDFSGLLVPNRRRAVPRRRNNKPAPGPTLVSLAFDAVAVQSAAPSAPGVQR